MADQVGRSFEDFVTATVANGPLLLVADDLQWADPGSIAALDGLLRGHPDLPLLVLALARPEVHAAFPALWTERALTELRLTPLSLRAASELLRAALPDADEALVARLVERAEGHPFFLEELARAAAAGGDDALPDTLLAMIQARIARLPASARRVLRAASVFGRTFWPGAVGALVHMTAVEVEQELAEPRRAGLVVPHAESRFPPEAGWIFRHDLPREAVYAMLSEADRVSGHRAAGAWLCEHGEVDARRLVDHFERGQAPDRALDHIVQAARQALDGNDLAGAAELAQRGLDLGASGEPRGLLLLTGAHADVWRGGLASATTRTEAALADLRPGSGPWFEALHSLVVSSMSAAQPDAARTFFERGLRTPAEPDARVQRIRLLARGVPPLLWAGLGALTDDARAALAADVACVGAGDPLVAAELALLEALDVAHAGDPAQAVLLGERAIAAVERVGDHRIATLARCNCAVAALYLGQADRAEALIEAAARERDRLDLQRLTPTVEKIRGDICALRRDVVGAEARYQEAAARAEARGDRRYAAQAHAARARILLSADRVVEAREAAAAAIADAAGVRATAALAVALEADAMRRGGDPVAALARAAEAMALAGEHNEHDATVRLVWVEALWAAGKADTARTALAEAVARLDARADRISEPAWRRSFLEVVPENARTQALRGAWAIDGRAPRSAPDPVA